jgi:hypothetical protein
MYFNKATKRAVPSATASVLSGSLTGAGISGIDDNGVWVSFASASASLEGKFQVIITSEL